VKPRHMAMGGALLVAALLVLFGDKTPDSGIAQPTERTAARAPAVAAAPAPRPQAASAKASAGEAAILRLIPRAQLIGEAGEGAFKSADGVFGGQTWNPPPPPAPPANAQAEAAPPPSAPPLPFAVLGKAAANGEWEVFLSRGEQTYVVRKNTVIDGSYRVDAIAPPTMTLTYLPMNQVQQLNIGVID
jgi:hypothetical protein